MRLSSVANLVLEVLVVAGCQAPVLDFSQDHHLEAQEVTWVCQAYLVAHKEQQVITITASAL